MLNKKFWTYVMAVVAILFVAIALIAGATDQVDANIFSSGGFFASMMVIGSIGDVTDQETTGDSISGYVYLIETNQIRRDVPFPKPNASRELSSIPMKAGQYMQYFEAHGHPSFMNKTDKGDITVTSENTFSMVMGGFRDKIADFVEQKSGGKFVIIYKDIDSGQLFVIGSIDRPVVLKGSETKIDKDSRSASFTFSNTALQLPVKYTGAIVEAPAAAHTQGATALSVPASNNQISIPNGTSATYAIATVSGLSANDKGRCITLLGEGAANAATIADNTAFVLEDGATWTARAGSRITFRVLDPATLVEVPGSRVQTV